MKEIVVVGIGASAGGLAALKTFFENVPENSGLAYVVVVHLSPEHESHLAEVIEPHAKIPVRQVNETTAIQADHAYVIPPGRNLSAINTHLRLSELSHRRRDRGPIDHFFRTLAETHGGQAIGVILTGSGNDGTLGVQEIKERGGVVLVQDPNEAEYDGMPQSAVATGLVDRILPVSAIPSAIYHATHTRPRLPSLADGQSLDDETTKMLRNIFAHVQALTGRDFAAYKRSTILRRIARRMQLRHAEELSDYLDRLRNDAGEAEALTNDLLVNVTSFFRDPKVFSALESAIFPELFEGKSGSDSIRIWSVGCATGEEAYSLAILLMEEAAKHHEPPLLQVFASDLHVPSLDRAREGIYLGDVASVVSARRLSRYFQKEDGAYRVRKDVRDIVVFAPHNLLGDPPFSRVDLISCRNLLIYLQREIQRDVVELFHYALKPDGFLVLGTSEVADAPELFSVSDKENCIYRKRNVPAPEPRLPVFPLMQSRSSREDRRVGAARPPIAYGTLHERMVERYAPPSMLVSPDDKVLHLSQHAGRYLVHPGGELTTNAVKLVREELRLELRAALHESRHGRRAVRSKPILVQFNGRRLPVTLDVRPSLEPDQDGFALVIFDESDEQNLEQASGNARSDQRAEQLTVEVDTLNQRLHSVVEEYETGQEEMKAANEELQSTNEELRSTMEELETSKEELQSMNEELQTVNEENRKKVEELAELSNDLTNLLSSTDIATLFLNRELRIQRFTPKVSHLFNVRAADRDRPLSDLTNRLVTHDLIADAQRVLEGLVPVEREVEDEDGAWHLTRVLPYRRSDDRIDGVVITFVDITERKRQEEALRESEARLEAELGSMKQLHAMVGRLLRSDELLEALDDVLQATMEITGASMGNVQLLDPVTQTLEIITQRGFPPEFLEHFRRVGPNDNSACARALASGTRTLIEDVQEDPEYEPHREIAATVGFRAVQSTPLLNREQQVLGILSTHYSEPHLPGESEFQMLDLYTRQAAELIEHVRSRESLQEADRRKNEFLAVLGHELRNPLAAIRTNVELIKLDGPDDPRVNRFRELVDRQTANLTRLVDDLVQVSRITRGDIHLQQEAVRLSVAIEDAVEETRSRIEEAGHRLVLDLPEKDVRVRGDATRLTQVFANLLHNAAKFTPRGGKISLTMTTERETAVVSVRDSGVGLAQQHLEGIFEMFYRVLPHDERASSGLGIGLPLVKRIVQLHGGTVIAKSEGEEQGSEFIVRLPITENAAAREAEDRTSGSRKRQKILVVEDQTDLLESFAAVLAKTGNEVRTAEDAERGFEVAKSFRPDVVVLDIGLPGANGYELARQIRAEAWGRKMLLIAQTGWGQDRYTQNAREAGFDHFLTKPVQLEDVEKLI